MYLKRTKFAVARLLLASTLLMAATPVAHAQEIQTSNEELPGDLAGSPVLQLLDEPLPISELAPEYLVPPSTVDNDEFAPTEAMTEGLMMVDPQELIAINDEEFIISERDFTGIMPEDGPAPAIAYTNKMFLPMVQGEGTRAAAKADAPDADTPELVDAAAMSGGLGMNANPNASGDFNGDGYSDIAIGVPYEAVTLNGQNIPAAGAVNVIYGSQAGLTATKNQLLIQNTSSTVDAEVTDQFGAALAVGDFNRDGYDDLAIGAPYESFTVNGRIINYAGAVTVIPGSPSGLTGVGVQFWHQDIHGVAGQAEPLDLFGWALSAGDFNADGYSDLAIGVPGEAVGTVRTAGAVNVLYGGVYGLRPQGNQIWFQDGENVVDQSEQGDEFGNALAAGNIDGREGDELVVGIRGEDIGNKVDAGAVHVFFGRSGSGLVVTGNRLISQDTEGIVGAAEAGDGFGWSLAIGNFNGDGYADLAIGVPMENPGQSAATNKAGAVNIIYGFPSGLTTLNNQVFHQDSPNFLDVAEANDQFGRTLVTGDFNKDGISDLAIGVPYEDIEGVVNAGAVHVIHGSYSGLTMTGSRLWAEAYISSTLNPTSIPGNLFGSTLYAGDYNGDGQTDLGIGVPGKDINQATDAGAVVIIYYLGRYWSHALWHQDSPGILDQAESNDLFSSALRNN
jgi:hypothetical protein